MKHIYYILGIVGVIAVVVLIGYFLRYRAGGPLTPGGVGGNAFTGGLPSGATTGGNAPSGGTQNQGGGNAAGEQVPAVAAGQKFGVISRQSALDYYIDSQNNAVLIRPAGQVVQVVGGNASVLSSTAIDNIIRAEFSYDGKKILAVFGDRNNPQLSVFDVANKSWQPLSVGLLSATWSPNDYRIAYFAPVKNSTALSLQTLDISNPKAKPLEIVRINIQDQKLNWLAPDEILMSDKGSAFAAGSVWAVNLKNKTLAPLINGYYGLESLWSATAGEGLVSSVNYLSGRNVKTSLFGLGGNLLNSLTFLTLPSKCAFATVVQNQTSTVTAATTTAKTKGVTATSSVVTKTITNNYLYCAVPRDQQKLSASSLPDDYEQMAFFTSDNFYKIDLASGDTTSVFSDPSRDLDATDLKIFNNTLFFVNRYDNLVYAITL